uniref:Carbohydrate kinase FGGY N-terminal domain-containing protein n=1 Tax=Cyprinodon variegatus TaxID=28743 RepID=A0A3Q2DE45_CYPVA
MNSNTACVCLFNVCRSAPRAQCASRLFLLMAAPLFPLYLGLDFSTQQLKVVAIDGDLSVVHQDAVQFDSELPHYR